jgi:hypothetical protein
MEKLSLRSVCTAAVVKSLLFVLIGDARPLSAQESQLLVILKPASDAEMRLSPTEAPLLRELARAGVSIPNAVTAKSEAIIAALRALREPLKEGYRELGTAPGSSSESPAGGAGGFAELVGALGAPPPVSEAEALALRRIAEASRLARPDPAVDGSTSGAAPSTNAAAPSKDGSLASKSSDLPSSLEESVRAALDGGVRVVLVELPRDPGGGGSGANGGATLAALLDAASAPAPGRPGARSQSRRPRVAAGHFVLVVLVPDEGNAALIFQGPGVRPARVLKHEISPAELAAALGRLVGASEAEVGTAGDALLGACGRKP